MSKWKDAISELESQAAMLRDSKQETLDDLEEKQAERETDARQDHIDQLTDEIEKLEVLIEALEDVSDFE